MRIKIWPSFNPKEQGEGGIRRIWEMQQKYLPAYGIELVSDDNNADLIAVHADEYHTDLPLVFHNHGAYWDGYDWPNWCYESNIKTIKMARYSCGMSVPSRFVHNVFARGMLLNPTVIHHGVDIENWEPSENYGYIGWYKNRTDPICSPEDLNILASMCPELSFVSTYGDSDLGNITLTGRLNFDRTKSIIQHASLYLATVKETGGVTILENMACGVVPVGWRWGVNPEIIDHLNTGYLAEPGNFQDLKNGVYYCLENRKRLSNNAREYVKQKHQWKDIVPKYVKLYEDTLRDATTPRTGPKVSVIVTAYNLENYLPACIESVLEQEFDDYELIIVDDNSPDSCGEIADGYARRYPQCKVIHNSQNLYLAEARNVGIDSAHGEYILPLDADDEIGRDALRVLSRALDQNQSIDIVTGKFELIEPDGRHWVSTWPPLNPSYNDQINHRNQMPYCSMYRKSWWERVGGYRRRWKSAEDAENWTRLMSYGAAPAHVTDLPTLIYNNRPNSMSRSNAEPNWTSWFSWSRYPQFTPFGASGTPDDNLIVRPVLDYDPIKVSVVIPVGPNHLPYLQDALDSLISQTFQNWEAVVVNDTGMRWFDDQGNHLTHYTKGFPFATFLDGDKCEGVAKARNKGVAVARGEYILFLDSDDFLQVLTLDVFYRAITSHENIWVYGDWMDEFGEIKQALEFDRYKILEKMPCSIVIMVKKEDFVNAGTFDEDAPCWEDYSLLLSLVENDIQGMRVKYPSFVYRYNAGGRREENYSREKECYGWIRKKHKKLYNGLQSV